MDLHTSGHRRGVALEPRRLARPRQRHLLSSRNQKNNLLQAAGRVQDGERTGVGGDAETKVGSVPQVKLGRLTVDKPEVNFFLKGSPVDRHLAGHIGVEVLRHFKIIFDYSRRQIILEPYRDATK